MTKFGNFSISISYRNRGLALGPWHWVFDWNLAPALKFNTSVTKGLKLISKSKSCGGKTDGSPFCHLPPTPNPHPHPPFLPDLNHSE